MQWLCKVLSDNALVGDVARVAAFLASRTENGACTMRLSEVAYGARCSSTAARNALRKLRQAGYLTKVGRKRILKPGLKLRSYPRTR